MLNLRDTAPDLDPTFRGGDGNVGIIRSPVRAIALPDNRHECRGLPSLYESRDFRFAGFGVR